MPSYFSFMLFVTIMSKTCALLCWKCDVRSGERECSYKGSRDVCKRGEVCMTVEREENNQMMLTRLCKQRKACENMMSMNERTCRRYNPIISHSVCYYCCADQDYCNAPHNAPDHHLLFQSRPEFPATTSPSHHATTSGINPFLPSSCDRKEICGALFIVDPDYFEQSKAN